MTRARARQLRLPRAMRQVSIHLVDSTVAQLAWPAGSIRAFRRVYAAKCTAASMRPLPVVARQLLRDETKPGTPNATAFSLSLADTSFADREFQPIAFGMAFDSAILHVSLQNVALEGASPPGKRPPPPCRRPHPPPPPENQVASLAKATHVGLRGMISLTVQSCRLGDVGGAKLLSALARRPPAAAAVTHLDLRANGMRADAASALADLLDAQVRAAAPLRPTRVPRADPAPPHAPTSSPSSPSSWTTTPSATRPPSASSRPSAAPPWSKR